MAFVIVVTLYERDDRNCSHRIEETIRFFVVVVVIDTTLSFRGNR